MELPENERNAPLVNSSKAMPRKPITVPETWNHRSFSCGKNEENTTIRIGQSYAIKLTSIAGALFIAAKYSA